MEHILVCPFNEKLITGLNKRALVITTDDFNILNYIENRVNTGNKLHAIKIRTDKALSDIDFREEWEKIPLALYTPDFGAYKNFLHKLNTLRKLNIRIFLSSDNDFNFTALKMLSSLNINCGLYFDNEPFNWELINDLMHYSVYSNTRHAPVEPFAWLTTNYEPAEYNDFSSVYFNDPSRFLYLNEKEQIALTEKDFLNNNFIGEGLNALENITGNKNYIDSQNTRYEIMLRMDECAFCQAFRICQGKFSDLANKNETCKPFLSDLLDAADYYYSKTKTGKEIWQL
jgi:hypothetical protein